jgi:AcrR family transcriptional regulator
MGASGDRLVSSNFGTHGRTPSARERLVRAADEALRGRGVDEVSIDDVAAAAGVSRATAFRQLGGRDQMIIAVALARSHDFARECETVMARHTGSFAKLEAGLVYLANELPSDPIMREFFVLTRGGDFGAEALTVAAGILGPAIDDGRRVGQVRNDIGVDEMVRWTVEQLYLAVLQSDRSEEAVVRRVRTFLVPALTANPDHVQPGAVRSRIETLTVALRHAGDALAALEHQLTGDTDTTSE